LKRRREANSLVTLLELERSHLPFPDEPPVVFPSAAKWRKLTERRKAKYEFTDFGGDMPPGLLRLREEKSKVVCFAGFDNPNTTLGRGVRSGGAWEIEGESREEFLFEGDLRGNEGKLILREV